jgi:hypothetical protein
VCAWVVQVQLWSWILSTTSQGREWRLAPNWRHAPNWQVPTNQNLAFGTVTFRAIGLVGGLSTYAPTTMSNSTSAFGTVAFRAVAFVALPAYRSTTIISVAVITYGTVTYLAVASVALLRLKTISYNLLSFAGVSITKHAVLWIGSDAHRVPIAILATVFCIIISKHLVRKPR